MKRACIRDWKKLFEAFIHQVLDDEKTAVVGFWMIIKNFAKDVEACSKGKRNTDLINRTDYEVSTYDYTGLWYEKRSEESK